MSDNIFSGLVGLVGNVNGDTGSQAQPLQPIDVLPEHNMISPRQKRTRNVKNVHHSSVNQAPQKMITLESNYEPFNQHDLNSISNQNVLRNNMSPISGQLNHQ